MKNIFLMFSVAFFYSRCVVPAFAADRVTTDVESLLRAEAATCISRADGGCAIQAHVLITQSDGGTRREDSDVIDLNGANRTACLDVVTRSVAAYKIGRF